MRRLAFRIDDRFRAICVLAIAACSHSPSAAWNPLPVDEPPLETFSVENTEDRLAILSSDRNESFDEGGPSFERLPVTGHGDAIVSVPSNQKPVPILVASHGAGGTPAWQCEVWGGIVGNRGFVLCPRGTRMSWLQDIGYFFRDHHALEKEVLAALDALKNRYAERIAPGPVVYVGFSQGAMMGALMVVNHPETFHRLVLIEGGESEWNVPIATHFREGGGERILLVCGIHSCAQRARNSLVWLGKAGLDARVEYVRSGGHAYSEPMVDRLLSTFDWVVAGDARWHKLAD